MNNNLFNTAVFLSVLLMGVIAYYCFDKMMGLGVFVGLFIQKLRELRHNV